LTVAVTNPTKLSDFSGFLTPAQAGPIFEIAARQSVVQQLAQQVPLGASGTSVPVVTGKLQANWVAEGAQKPVSAGAMALKNMSPKKIAVISVVSAETVRANPGGYMTQLRNQVAESFAIAFDEAALHGVNTPYSTYVDQTTKVVALGTADAAAGSVFADLNTGLGRLVADGHRLTGWAFDDRMEPVLNATVDTTGRPLFLASVIDGSTVRGGTFMGRPAFMGQGVGADTPGTTSTTYALGYAGDWQQAAWGVIGGIQYDVSTETTVTINGALVSLWEHNLVAIRAEAEYGFLVNDANAFVKYTAETPAS
jgi:HK97 family phage major capsid protein